MKELSLTNSHLQVTLEDSDYLRVINYKWGLNKSQTNYRIVSTTLIMGKRVNITNFIMNKYDVLLDHIDRNIFNVFRDNLREATYSQNAANISKYNHPFKNCTSQFKGLYWDKKCKKWRVTVKGNYIGVFKNEVDAAFAYNEAALKY